MAVEQCPHPTRPGVVQRQRQPHVTLAHGQHPAQVVGGDAQVRLHVEEIGRFGDALVVGGGGAYDLAEPVAAVPGRSGPLAEGPGIGAVLLGDDGLEEPPVDAGLLSCLLDRLIVAVVTRGRAMMATCTSQEVVLRAREGKAGGSLTRADDHLRSVGQERASWAILAVRREAYRARM